MNCITLHNQVTKTLPSNTLINHYCETSQSRTPWDSRQNTQTLPRWNQIKQKHIMMNEPSKYIAFYAEWGENYALVSKLHTFEICIISFAWNAGRNLDKLTTSSNSASLHLGHGTFAHLLWLPLFLSDDTFTLWFAGSTVAPKYSISCVLIQRLSKDSTRWWLQVLKIQS